MKKNGKTSSCVVLLSGGQDSTTCLYWALKKFDTIYCMAFDYGQSHSIELEAALKISGNLDKVLVTVDIKGLLPKSSLTEHSDHNKPSYLDDTLPASFTPGRNLLFLTIAASWAAQRGINDLVTGVCQTDFSGYPDCRRTTIDAMQLALSLGVGNGDIRIHTPLMYLDKAQTWKMAKDLDCLDVIINETVTDYDGDETMNEWGRGNLNNPSSKLRAKGYFQAKENGWL